MTDHPASAAGIAADDLAESHLMIVWPSVAIYPLGRLLGRLYAITWPDWYILRLGNLLALLAIPLALVLYFLRVAPGTAVRYRLTSRRIAIQRGLAAADAQSLGLDEFDSIRIDVLPGQQWYDAGDLVFLRAGVEVYRLPAVSRPAAFRQCCRKAQAALLGVRQALEAERAGAGR